MNKDLLINGLMFCVGAAVGSVVTWKLVKTKYEQYANEEIESVKEVFSKKSETTEEKGSVEETDIDDLSVEEIKHIVQEHGYANEAVINSKNNVAADEDTGYDDEEEEDEDMEGPEVIPPEESWERDYPTITLYYYEEDKVLTDDRNKIVVNVDELVGEDFAEHFGEYEEDSVLVRNDKIKAYYEILREYGSYPEKI